MGARYGGARRNGYWRKLLGDQRLGWVEKLDAKLIVATDHLGKRDLFDGGPPEVVPHSGLPFVKRFLAVEQCEAQPMIVTCAEHLNKSMQRLAKREDIPGGRIDEAPVYLKRTEPPSPEM